MALSLVAASPTRGRSTCRIINFSSSTTMGLHRPKSPIPKLKAIIRRTVSPAHSSSPTDTLRKKPAHLQGGKFPKLPKHVVLQVAAHSLHGIFSTSVSQSVSPLTLFLAYLANLDIFAVKHLRQTLLPSLYHTLDLRTNRSILRLLPALPHRPEIQPHIKQFIVRPNNVLYTPPGEEMDERRVADWVTDLLGGGSMDGLEGFVWDGREMATEDVWLVLRTECPLITRLGTSIGGNPLNSRSHFYEFSNLTSLSLSVKCPEYGWTTGPPPAPEKFPRRFWAMLIERCPGLVSLSFTGHAPCPRIFDARHIMHGRWEHLRHLEVGEMVCFLEGSSSNPASENGHSQRRSPSRSSVTLASSCGILTEYTGLRSLSLWVDFSFSGGIVESILRSITPHLESIELWLLTRSGCAVDDVLLAFRTAASPALRALKLMVLFDGKDMDTQRVWSLLPGMREVEIWKSAEPWLSACGGWVALSVAAYEWKDAPKFRARRRRAYEVQLGLSRAALKRTPGSTSTTSSSGSSGSVSSKSTSVSTTQSLSGAQYQKPLPHAPAHSPSTSVFSNAPSTISFSSLPPQNPIAHRGSFSTPSSPSMPAFPLTHSTPAPAPAPLIFLSDSGKIPSPSPSEKRTNRRASLSTINPPPSAFSALPASSSANVSRRPSSFMGMQPPSSWRSSSPTKLTSNGPAYTPPPPSSSKRPSSAGAGAEKAPPSTWLSRRLSFTSISGEKSGERRMSVGSAVPRAMNVHFDDPPVSRAGSVDGHGSRPVSMHGESGGSHPSSIDGHIGSRPASISGDSRRSKKSLRNWVGSVVGRG
ncbi:hypothetical protein BDQ17DRAFT_1351300 [Cyathus striatus]|nr:hypothetical protein BDQ17DRAFT_1351300 [Cyathus striatus]